MQYSTEQIRKALQEQAERRTRHVSTVREDEYADMIRQLLGEHHLWVQDLMAGDTRPQWLNQKGQHNRFNE